MLVPTRVYELHQHHYNYSFGLYYAVDIEYFGSKHLPYGILAIVMCLFFVILPVTTLALYPFTFFQRILNLFPVHWYILHTFMDTFQGSCYTTRNFPLHISCYFLIIIPYAFTISMISSIIAALILMFIAILIMAVQPYKSSLSHLNFINALFMFGLSSLFISIAGHALSVVFDYQCIYFFSTLSRRQCVFILSFFVSYLQKQVPVFTLFDRMKEDTTCYQNQTTLEQVLLRILKPVPGKTWITLSTK